MPVYKVNIDRKVINWDRFTRYVECENEQQALTLAADIANQANKECPDDFMSGLFDDDLDDWEVSEAEEAEADDLEHSTNIERSHLPTVA